MFSVKVKDPGVFLRLESKLKDSFRKVIANKEMLNEVGEFAAERIRFQARTAKPLNSNAKFPSLKPSTIKSREYIAKHNQTHETYGASRSNLTITGQLLNAIKHKVVSAGVVAIELVGNHRGYKSGSGQTGRSVANSDIAGWLADKGFVIFDESIQDNKTIKARLRSIVLRYVRRAIIASRFRS